MIAGDTRAVAQRELEARLRPFVARRVSPSDVDDVLQDVFLRMQRALSHLRDEDRFGPWVYRVARSAIAEQHRMRLKHPLTNGEIEDAIAASEASSDRDSGDHALAHAVQPFVAILPSPYREAVTLVELQGLSHQEAASRLGLSLTAMKSRVRRGRARLRELLEECCVIALDARGGVVDCSPRAARKPQCAC